jgi:hypothetical protein
VEGKLKNTVLVHGGYSWLGRGDRIEAVSLENCMISSSGFHLLLSFLLCCWKLGEGRVLLTQTLKKPTSEKQNLFFLFSTTLFQGQGFSGRGHFTSQWLLGNVWGHFWLS